MSNADLVTADHRDLLRAIRDALAAGVRAAAVRGAVEAVLLEETTELEAAIVLRRLTRAKPRRAS